MPGLKVGIAQVDYAPPVGLPLMGHLRDDYASRGVHDPLFSKALVFANSSGEKLAVLSVDVCMLDRNEVGMMRDRIASQSDIPPERILIAATHIHSGPATMGIYAAPKADGAAVDAFLKRAAGAVLQANENLMDATLRVGYAHEDRLSFNRRLRDKDGITHMNWEAFDPDSITEALGPIDPQVLVLLVERQDEPAAALVNFALHPAILDYTNWLYSAGWPGYMAEGLRKIFGQGFITLFLNGCCGNVNHLDYRDPLAPSGYRMTQRVGYMLAAAVKEAANSAVGVVGDELSAASQTVALERIQIGDEDCEWALHALESSQPTGGLDGLPTEHIAPTWIEMRKHQDRSDAVEVMALRVGEVGFAALPGEIFCEFGLYLKERSPAKHTVVVELANDGAGYFPTREAFDQGGYEVTPGATKYVPGSSERLVDSALRQLETLYGK